MAPKKKAAKPAPRAASKKPAPKAVAKPAPKAVKAAVKAAPKAEKHESCGCGGSCNFSCLREACPVFATISSRAFWITLPVVFIAIFGFDMLWNQYVMMTHYQATAGMWRPEAEMDVRLLVGYEVLLAAIYTALVLIAGRTCTWWGGTATGLLAGALIASTALVSYATMPFPSAVIPQLWAVAALVQGALAGLTVTAVIKSGWAKNESCCNNGDTCCKK